MRLERERTDGRRDFWEATAAKKAIAINSGIVNVKHKKETKAFDSTKDAKAALEKLIATKRKAGFSEPIAIGSQFLPAPLPINPELEATIRDDGYGVYADWLQTQSPVGEWIALTAAMEKKKDARKQKKLDELAVTLGLPTHDFATWGTRHGFFEWLRLENDKDWMANDFDPLAFAKKLFATPLCAALDELRIGILRWDYNSEDVPAVIAEAGEHAWSKSLARLHLGDVDDNIDMAHHVVGDVGEPISKAFPNLRSLKLHSGSQEWRGGGETFGLHGLALGKLETLIVETCAMTKDRLMDLFAAKLPAVTKLELWFGGADDDSNVKAKDLAKLLDGKAFPKVTDLGLRNHEFIGDLVDRLAASTIAPRLTSLDLSMSTLDDTTTPQLAAVAAGFSALRTLNVDDNFVTPAALGQLRAAFKNVEVVSKKQAKLEYGDDDYRFCSVSE